MIAPKTSGKVAPYRGPTGCPYDLLRYQRFENGMKVSETISLVDRDNRSVVHFMSGCGEGFPEFILNAVNSWDEKK